MTGCIEVRIVGSAIGVMPRKPITLNTGGGARQSLSDDPLCPAIGNSLMSTRVGGHPDEVPLTDAEEKAIMALKRVAATWPRSLWLFSAAGALCVMRQNADGQHAFVRGGAGIDPAYLVDQINGIDTSGGDW